MFVLTPSKISHNDKEMKWGKSHKSEEHRKSHVDVEFQYIYRKS